MRGRGGRRRGERREEEGEGGREEEGGQERKRERERGRAEERCYCTFSGFSVCEGGRRLSVTSLSSGQNFKFLEHNIVPNSSW